MGSNSPARYRKEGREAFGEGCDARHLCPYKDTPWSGRDDWLEGWEQAEKEYNKEQERLENCPYEELRNKIYDLMVDPSLSDILINIVNVLEEEC